MELININTTKSINKLIPIADLISTALNDKFHIPPSYTLESTNNWLLNSPTKDIHYSMWESISEIYSLLVDRKWDLDTRISEYKNQINLRSQRIDIWFSEPFNFIVEFDESQHFNQFRLITLENFASYNNYSFDLEHYLMLAKSKVVNPGNSGFQKVKRYDPLFPPMLDSDKQDNRLRQRAFRDFLKDITPSLKGFNWTIRISYKIANGKIDKFTEQDLNEIKAYILKNEYLDKLNL